MIKIPLKDGSDYEIPEDFYRELNETYYDLSTHLQNMRIWCLANDENKKTRKGAKRFVAGWLSRSAKVRPRGMPLSISRADDVKKSVMPDSVRAFLEGFKR